MADKKGIIKLDEKLISMNVIPGNLLADLPLVHRKMNSILKKTGAVLTDEIFETGNIALRKWLLLLNKQGASQEKLTAYLRCGLAHLTYDFIESQYHQIGIDDLVSRAFLSMKLRNLHTSFFKPPVEVKKVPEKKNTAAKGKVPAIKKSELAKPAAKAKAKAKPAAKAKAKTKPAAKAKVKAKQTVKAKTKPAVKAKAKAKPAAKAKAKAKPAAKAKAKPAVKAKPKAKLAAKAKARPAVKKAKAKAKAKPAAKK